MIQITLSDNLAKRLVCAVKKHHWYAEKEGKPDWKEIFDNMVCDLLTNA